MFPLRLRTSLLAISLIVLPTLAAAQGIGISGGVPYTIDPVDTAVSPYLPSFSNAPAGAHGFLKNDGEGNFLFDDGTPARFFGVTLQWSACFPDSAYAIAMAARLRKLGVNLVRFQYLDNAYDWWQAATFLDQSTGFRTLHPEQMRRFDWLVHQLKSRGIYSYLPLVSARAARAGDGVGSGADSATWLGKELNFLYPQASATNRMIARLVLEHVNPFTSIAYKDEPAIAMLEGLDQGSLISMYRLNYTEHRPGQYGLSLRNSRRLDTLYIEFLKRKYASTAALAAAWRTTVPQGGFPNLVQEGSFEGDFERVWNIDSYDGVSVTKILAQNDSVPDGAFSLTLRLRNTKGGDATLYNAFMQQAVPLEFNTVYMLTYKAKSTNPSGHKIHIIGSQAGEGGMYAGLSEVRQVATWWREDTAFFLMPLKSPVPIAITIYYGSGDGELRFDDIRIRKFDAPGLVPGESLEAYSVGRVPWSNPVNALVNSKRIEDQSEFYLSLERDYYDDMRRYIRDSVGARQPFTGAGHYWASGYMETSLQARSDFTLTSAGWDWIEGSAGDWRLRNYSQTRLNYGGTIYNLAAHAHRRQPFLASYAHPFPNRYQAESMLFLPAYSSLQDWDGIIWDVYADNAESYTGPERFIDTGMSYPVLKNPIVTSLMPAAAQLFRGRLLAPAQTTLNVQHAELQAKLLPRMEWAWGYYAVPGGMHGRAMLANKLVNDSVDAEYFTQADDIAFANEIEGMAQSDTREIIWEYSRGAMSIDAESAQGVAGYLTRAGGITLRNLDVNLQSLNETATILWVPLDTAKPLGAQGRSFLVLASRTEPTGWHWADTSRADMWGAGPMVIDPMRVRLTFKPEDDAVNVVRITPLDSSGMPMGSPIIAKRSGSSIVATIDQNATHALWYSVELVYDPSSSVEQRSERGILSAQPSIVTDRAYITLDLPGGARNGALELFDAIGRRVRLLRSGSIEPGPQSIRLDADGLPAGAYVLRLRTEAGHVATAKITVMK